MANARHDSTLDDRRQADARRFVDDVRDAIAAHRLDDLLPSLRQVEGPDRTGAVSCVVDAGGHFQDLHLQPTWRQQLDGAALGTAILEALDYARSKAGMLPLILRRHGIPVARTSAAGGPPDPPLPPGGTPGYLEAVEDRMREAYRLLDDAEARMAAYANAAEATVSSPRGVFRATARGGHVLRLDADRYAAETADVDLLTAEARAVLHTATTPRF